MGQWSSSVSDHASGREDEVDSTLELRRLFHGLARSLEAGTSTRLGLPVELVIYILRLSDCFLPSPRLSVSAATQCHAQATSGEISRISWFSTPPFDRHMLSKVATIQLLTISRDQGWCSDPRGGSWSWFEIAILSTDDGEAPRSKRSEIDGRDLVWKSHHNPVAGREFSRLDGIVFDRDHEIWNHLAEGAVIEIRVCAQYGAWDNNAREGVLKVMEWFEPTLPPRKSAS